MSSPDRDKMFETLKSIDKSNKCKECGAELVKQGACMACPVCGEGGCEG